MVTRSLWAMVVPSGTLAIFTKYEMIDLCDTGFVFIHLPRIFLSMDIHSK